MRTIRIALLLLLAASCAPRADSPELAFGTPVRVVAQSLGPGLHEGSIGSVGDCVVVMIPEPPDAPIRLKTLDFARISQLEVGDTTGRRWTRISSRALRSQPRDCLP